MKIKVCPKCKIEKLDLEFNKKKTSKDGLSSYCKECNKENLKLHYKNNKDYYYNKSRTYLKKVQKWFTDYKETLKCNRCPESRPWVLDFHHLDPKEKEGAISTMINTSSRKKILEEIDKCEILCSNCHRDLHYQERLTRFES